MRTTELQNYRTKLFLSILIAVIFTIGMSAQSTFNCYPELNLDYNNSGSINNYSIGEVQVCLDSKYGISEKPFVSGGERTTFKYLWDISNIPSSEYPIKIVMEPSNPSKDLTFHPQNINSQYLISYNPETSSNNWKAEFVILNPVNQFEFEFELKTFIAPLSLVRSDFPHILEIIAGNTGSKIARAQSPDIVESNYYNQVWLPELQNTLSFYESTVNQPNYDIISANQGLRYEPNSTNNGFVMDIDYTFKDKKLFLGENASIIIDADVTFENTDIFGYEKLWDKIVVKSGASLTLKNCNITDGLQGVVVEAGGTLESVGSNYFDNYRSISIVKGDEPLHEFEADLTNFLANRITSSKPTGINYPIASYFYDIPSNSPIATQQPVDNSHCGIFINRVKAEIGNKGFLGSKLNYVESMANGFIINNSSAKVGGFSIDGMKEDATENYEIQGNGIYADNSYFYINGGYTADNQSNPGYYTIQDCYTGINLNNSYNNLIYYTRIKDCNSAIKIEQKSSQLADYNEKLPASLQLHDQINNNRLEQNVNGIEIYPWFDIYFNLSRNTYVQENIIESDLTGASGIISTGFRQSIKDNDITLNSSNNDLGDAAIRIVNNGAYIPEVIQVFGAPPSLKFVDGGSNIYDNDIVISEVKNGIVTAGGRFNNIIRNSIYAAPNSNSSDSREDLISSRGSRAHISYNDLNYDNVEDYPNNPYFMSGVQIENSINSLVSCNKIAAGFTEADFFVMGENAGSTVRGNLFIGTGDDFSHEQILYGTEEEGTAITGAQQHQGNQFFNYNGTNLSVKHNGTVNEVSKSKYLVEGQTLYDPQKEDPSTGWFVSESTSDTYSCVSMSPIAIEANYRQWYNEKVGTGQLSDSLFLERLNIGNVFSSQSYSSQEYFDLEYGMDLFENDSILNTQNYSSFKTRFLNNQYDDLYDLRKGLTFKVINSLEGDSDITYTEIDSYWNSVNASDSTQVLNQISHINSALNSISYSPTDYLIKNEVETHEILESLIDPTDAISNYTSQLYAIATECPFQGGKSVYFARFLYNKFISPTDFEAMELCASSNLRSTQQSAQVSELKIYPNPVQNRLRLNKKNGNYRIFSIDGKLIQSKELNTNEIDVSQLASGMYILETQRKGNNVQTIKFVKQ